MLCTREVAKAMMRVVGLFVSCVVLLFVSDSFLSLSLSLSVTSPVFLLRGASRVASLFLFHLLYFAFLFSASILASISRKRFS
mmetsp:Transcript_36357/g.54255  ORF Transcript_36357/g.54255 Transcript_36357/m.54255 type:complete len:83 (-) Transcript_36357:1428-1676(-)